MTSILPPPDPVRLVSLTTRRAFSGLKLMMVDKPVALLLVEVDPVDLNIICNLGDVRRVLEIVGDERIFDASRSLWAREASIRLLSAK